MKHVILDTDIGDDVDDFLALIYLAKCKEVKLEAITTVCQDTEIRAKIAKKVLDILKYKQIEISSGANIEFKEMLPKVQMEDILDKNENYKISKKSAVDVILSKSKEHGKNSTIICIGPLTNIANAIKKDPETMKLSESLYIMGGINLHSETGYKEKYVSHNFRVDPEAAKIVINSGLPITLITTDVAKMVYLEARDLDLINAQNTEISDLAYKYANHWKNVARKEVTYLYDVLAAASAINNDYIQTKKLKCLVETKGEYTKGMLITQKCEEEEEEARINVSINTNPQFIKKNFMEIAFGIKYH